MEVHESLATAVAAREGRASADLTARATAWMAIFVLREVGAAAETGDSRDATVIAAEVMRGLAAERVLVPRA